MPPPELIGGPGAITADWLEAVFRHAGRPVPPIASVHAHPIGRGNLSSMIRLDIRYKNDAREGLRSVVCKLTPENAETAMFAASYGAMEREAEVYKRLKDVEGLGVPAVYMTEASADGAAINLVMEDLSPYGQEGDEVAGVSTGQARAVIDELAKIHIAFWGHPFLDRASWLLGRKHMSFATDDSFRRGARIVRERFAGRIDPAILDGIDQFIGEAGKWTQANSYRQTLVHGEMRVNNIFLGEVAGEPKAWLIDWQFSDAGSPMFDTAYFLAGGLSSEDRRACERGLVRRHRAHLAKAGIEYGLEQALNEYAASLPFVLFATVGAANVLLQNEENDRRLMTLLERNVSALIDWNVFPRG